MHTQYTTGRTSDDSVEYLSSLEGLIPREVCAELYELAEAIPRKQAIVELGSYKGKSTCCLGMGANSLESLQCGGGAHVYAVDAWDLYGNTSGKHGFMNRDVLRTFWRQVEQTGLVEHVTSIKAFSTQAARGWQGPEVGLLYIDADHHESSVREDYGAWRPHLAPGAFVVFDDLDTPLNPGVRVVVDELADELHCEKRAGRLGVGVYG